MSSEPIISVRDLSKAYNVYDRPRDIFLEAILGGVRHDVFWALRAVDLDIFEGQRTNLPFPLSPGESQSVLAIVEAPPVDGSYRLQLTLVQEKCRWFDTVDGDPRPSAKIIVV